MLYATTRNQKETYTAQRALCEKRAPDGGFYVPFRHPAFDPEALEALEGKPFRDTAAELINLLFNTRLSGWDLEFTLGKQPIRLCPVGRRTLSCERWRNPGWCFEGLVKDLVKKIRADQSGRDCGSWAQVGTGIALLFAAFSQIRREGFLEPGQSMDVAAASENLFSTVSALYAKAWGLPIGTVVVGCNDNSCLWDLLHNGQMRTGGVSVHTLTPEADFILPEGMEMLLWLCGGQREAQRYLEAAAVGKTSIPMDQTLQNLRSNLAVSVISDKRVLSTIPTAYATHHYLMSPYGALAYAGLLDYRAGSGTGGWGMILCDRGPSLDRTVIARALGVSDQRAGEILNNL